MEREGCRDCGRLKIPGMRFDPSDEELVAYYLREKIEGRPLRCNHLMTELQIYHDDFMPWEIIKDDNPYWISSNKNKIKKTIYVFTELRRRKQRVMRTSGRGSWTGQNKPVVKNRAGDDIGYNKFLTFYKKGKKKNNNRAFAADDDQDHGHWMMHEYSLFGIDNYVLCKIIKEVRISAKASVLCPTKAAPSQDLHIMNVVSEDQERQSGDSDQTLDESATDWDKNGWMEELYQEFGMDVQELPVLSQPITFDGQQDKNTVCNNQIPHFHNLIPDFHNQIPDFHSQPPHFLLEEEAFAAVNQPSDELGADLDVNGQNSVLYERFGTAPDNHNRTGVSAGVGVVQELPVFGVMDNHQQGQVIQYISLDETVAGLQKIPVAVWGKNGQLGDGSYKGFDGAGIHDVIVLDDDSAGIHNVIVLDDDTAGIHDGQDLMIIEAADVNDKADNDMKGSEQIFDDCSWNFELLGDDPAFLPTNSICDGSDAILDFFSPELVDLWPYEFIEESCSISQGQLGKRMRCGEEDCERRPSGKKQHCL